MGVIQDIFGGNNSTVVTSPILGQTSQQNIFSGLINPTVNGGVLQGASGYPNPLSPNINNTMLPGVFGSYSPTTQGTDWTSQMLSGGAFNSGQSPFSTPQSNMQQYGGIGGYPLDLLHGMAQFGGTGGPGNYGMSNLMQFGAAGQAGQPLNNMAQSGVSGSWGQPLMAATQGLGAVNGLLQAYNNPTGALSLQDMIARGGNPQGAGGGPLGGFATQGGMQALQQLISSGGSPINQTPAWQSMVDSQQRNIGENMARLQESFGSSGNRFSTAYGTAATDYMNQATKDQNALLGQMTANAGESALSRMLSAGGTLGGLGLSAAQQLGAQGFQSGENAQGRLLQASSTLGGFGLGAAGQQSSQTYGAGNMLAQLGAGAAGQLSNNSLYGTGQLFGGENQGAMAMYNGQNQLLPAFMNYNLGLNQQGLGAAQGLNSMLMGNLGMGSQLGGQQYGLGQSAINNDYQEWLRQQPYNNPLLPYVYGLGTAYNQNQQSSSNPGIMGGLGSLLGGISGFFKP